jgi:hypothetical protein
MSAFIAPATVAAEPGLHLRGVAARMGVSGRHKLSALHNALAVGDRSETDLSNSISLPTYFGDALGLALFVAAAWVLARFYAHIQSAEWSWLVP